MSKHDQHQEARTALESGVAAVEKIIRDRDVETQIAQLRLGRLLGLIERDRLVREWFEAFNGDSLGPSEWFKLEVLLESPPQSRDGTSAHDDGCEADWGPEGQESPCRCAERAQGEPSDAQVEAAAQAMFEPDGPGGEYTWAEMVAEDPSRADIWREDARKVLRAAGGAR